MTARWVLILIALASVHLADAQQPKKVPRIGYLGTNPRSVSRARIDAFRQGLRDLGYRGEKHYH